MVTHSHVAAPFSDCGLCIFIISLCRAVVCGYEQSTGAVRGRTGPQERATRASETNTTAIITNTQQYLSIDRPDRSNRNEFTTAPTTITTNNQNHHPHPVERGSIQPNANGRHGNEPTDRNKGGRGWALEALFSGERTTGPPFSRQVKKEEEPQQGRRQKEAKDHNHNHNSLVSLFFWVALVDSFAYYSLPYSIQPLAP